MANCIVVDGDLPGSSFVTEFQSLASDLPELGVSILSSEEFLYAVKSYCNCGRYQYEGADTDKKLVVIMGHSDTAVADKVLSIVDSPLAGVAVPRIIFLSSLLTWAGKGFNMGAGNIWDETTSYDSVADTAFWNRQPLPGSYDLYSFENKLAATVNAEVSIVGLGCVYGGNGHDYEQVFKDVWNFGIGEESAKVKLKSMLGGDNKVPSIHYMDLAKALTFFVSFEGSLPKFLPASNCANLSLNETISSILSYVDGKPVAVSDGIQCLSQTEIAQEMIQETSDLPKSLLWNTDLSFEAEWMKKYSGSTEMGGRGILDNMESVWSEFLTGHRLSPVSVFIAGNPQSGKTSTAKAIQETLQCQYVDVPVSVSFALKTQMEENSAGGGVKGEIMAIVEAKAAEGKKAPKKGEPEEPVEVDPATVEVNEQLLGGLSPELKRKCLSLMLKTDKLCLRRGYVMDVWDSDVIGSMADLTEVMKDLPTPSLPAPEPVDGEEPPAEEAPPADADEAKEGTEGEEKAEAEEPASKVPLFPELVIEIQCSDEVLMARLHAEHGIENGDMKKASKEAQAAVKDFETKLSGYSALMEAIPIPEPEASAAEGGEGAATTAESTPEGGEEAAAEPEEPVEPEFTHSHKTVLEMAVDKGCTSAIFRIKASERSLEEMSLLASQEVASTHGIIGWLSEETRASLVKPEPSPAPSADEASPVDASAEGSAVEESKTGTEPVGAAAPPRDVPEQVALYEDMCKIVDEAKESAREGLVSKAVELQDYLLENVMSELSKCMVEIVQNQPEDPLMMLADRLEEVAAERERVAKEKAEIKFKDLLAKAEAGETVYAEDK